MLFVGSVTAIGLGSGSTMSYFIRELGGQLRSGTLRDVLAVPTSKPVSYTHLRAHET